MIDPTCQELAQKLFEVTSLTDKHLKNLQKKLQLIEDKYKPRHQFNRWRVSDDGKQWKKKKWNSQKKCCAICNEKIALKGSHIDHIKPLSKYPYLALDTQNMQVTCMDCNIHKSSKIDLLT